VIPQFLRGHGLRPSSLKARAGRLVGPSRISRRRFEQFLADVDSRPPVSLPPEPPGTLAVVVPAYAHEAYLPAMLESIVAQTRLPDEVVLVDDCSLDGSRAILQAFVASDPLPGGACRLIVNESNVGQSASLNRGIAAATSDLVMILNDDDYLMHDAVATMLTWFRLHPEAALIGANHVRLAGPEALTAAPKLSTDYARPDQPLEVRSPQEARRYRDSEDLRMTHSGMCFRKVAWDAVGGYRPDPRDRILVYSERDFQIRVNALFPVAIGLHTPLAFWRTDSSVDRQLNS